MGFDSNGARFLLDSARAGVNFNKCAVLGRQEMHLDADALSALFKRFGIDRSREGAREILNNNGESGYAEEFLRVCGARTIVSMDNSNYERATIVHDMNTPVPDDLKNSFDCVIDGGTLEHVFNFPVAIQNCMKMLRKGGNLLIISPCNNFMGHGFYQFSPELFFGVLSSKNGFSVKRMFICESRPGAQWYIVADPKHIGGRVELVNAKMTYLFVQAQRVSSQDIEDITPQQSDYVPMWEGETPASALVANRVSLFAFFKGKVKEKVRDIQRMVPVESIRTPFQRPWYEPYE